MAERRTVLIAGGEGQLAKALAAAFADVYRVAAPGHTDMDVSDARAVTTYIDSLQPALVLHAAAYTDVDGCESNKPLAYQVNAVGSENVASACARANVRLIAFSTDYVFDGAKNEPYTEADDPNPINAYGRSKLEGERRILTIHRDASVMRTGWLYGGEGRNFLTAIVGQIREGKRELRVVADQVGGPTSVGMLARQVRKLAEADVRGVFHATASGATTWFTFAKEIAERLNPAVSVVPISSEELNRPAPRPAYSVLDNARLRSEHLDIMPAWEDGLGAVLESMKVEGATR